MFGVGCIWYKNCNNLHSFGSWGHYDKQSNYKVGLFDECCEI